MRGPNPAHLTPEQVRVELWRKFRLHGYLCRPAPGRIAEAGEEEWQVRFIDLDAVSRRWLLALLKQIELPAECPRSGGKVLGVASTGRAAVDEFRRLWRAFVPE